MTETLPESPLPADLLPITRLVGTVASFSKGGPSGGSVTFTTDGYVVAGNPPAMIVGASETVPIDPATGRFEIEWVPGNDPDGAPSTVTATFTMDSGVVIPPRTIVVPIVIPQYPPLLDAEGIPVYDASGNIQPDTSQAPTYPPVNFFAQAPVPAVPNGETTAPVVLEDTTLFTRAASEGAPNGVATLDEDARLPVYQLIDPTLWPDGAALVYDRSTGKLRAARIDGHWRGAVTETPTDEGTIGDYFTNAAPVDGGPILWYCVRTGGIVDDGSSDEAQWLPFGGGGTGGGGGITSVGASEPIQSSGGARPTISILPATQLRPGSMSAKDFVKLGNIADGATKYDDEQAQDAVARMILAGTHVGLSGTYDDQANAFSFRVTAEAGLLTGVSVAAPLTTDGSATNPKLGIDTATTSRAGAMSATMVTKLDGIAAEATRNDTDANLRKRSAHTGTQKADTIEDLETVVRGYGVKTRRVTGNTTITADDEYLRVDASAAVTVTYPSHATTPLGIGRSVVVRQVGTGQVTVVGAGIALNGATKTAGQHTSLQLLKTSTSEVDVEGGVAS